MTAEDNRYLWDPAAAPDPDVQALERRLEGARFDPARRPIVLPSVPVRAGLRLRATFAFAAAAVAVFALGVAAWWSWRSTWTAGAAWAAEIESLSQPSRTIRTALAVDQPLHLAPTDSARVNIARIGNRDDSAAFPLLDDHVARPKQSE